MFSGPNNIVVWILLASSLRFSVEHNRGSSFRDVAGMDDLDSGSKHKLNPEVPAPVKVLLNRATANATDD